MIVSNKTMVIFSKREKIHIKANTYICHTSADSFVFKQKIYCSFLQMEGVCVCGGGGGGSQKGSFFVAIIIV